MDIGSFPNIKLTTRMNSDAVPFVGRFCSVSKACRDQVACCYLLLKFGPICVVWGAPFKRGARALGFVELHPIFDDVPSVGAVADFFKWMASRFNVCERWLKATFPAPASVVIRKRVGRRVTPF